MPVITTAEDRPLCPAGAHVLTLMDVELKEMDNFEKTGKTERLIWTFMTKKVNPETRNPYELVIFTGTQYGPKRAKLTGLLDMLLPGITAKQADQLDTDTLIGGKFESQIKHTPSATDASKLYAEPLYLKALQPSPFAETELGADPFAES